MNDPTYGDFTLTLAQMQERFNAIPGMNNAIGALQEAITAFLNTEQVQSLITTALADYSTTSEMNTAIAQAITTALASYYTKTAIDEFLNAKVDKVNGKGLSTEDFTTALKTKLDGLPNSTDLATQISTAISNALTSYYTKTETDTLLAAKQTAQQVSDAIASALTSYSTTTQMNTAISNAISTALASYYTKTQVDESQAAQNAKIQALESAVAGLEAIAEGYVRVSGSSSPALSYKSYKFNENGDFSRESVFSLFYPCLIGTKLTGNDDQIGTILHVLQKLGYEDGNGKALDIYGNEHAIDGSEGDVMVCNIEPYYRIAGHKEVDGVTYDVFLVAREPFAWKGYDAEEIARGGSSPDYCVSHTDTDNVVRMHSVYNPAWNGSYTAPVGMVGKYIYSQNEETGVITEAYDSEATLLGGAGGLHSTDITLPNGEQYAMNQNDDTTKTVPFMNQTAEMCNQLQSLLLAEGGTFDAHNATKMGSGFCSNDGANAAVFDAAGSEARNGIRYVNGQNQEVYMNLNVNNPFSLGSNHYSGDLINSLRNPWHIMEAHRAVSYAVKKGVGELEWFVFEGNKYKYRSVPGFNGPSRGEMTCVVWKVLSSRFTNAAIDPADGTTLLTGNRIDYIISTALFHGITTQVSPSWWVSGLIFTEDENRDYKCYMERDQAALVKSVSGDFNTDVSLDFESYPMVGEFAVGEGYAKDYMEGALMLPNTNANKSGGGLHTYVGKYNWFTGAASPEGKKSVRGFRRGDGATYTNLSPLTLYAYHSPSGAASFIGFGTCVRLR